MVPGDRIQSKLVRRTGRTRRSQPLRMEQLEPRIVFNVHPENVVPHHIHPQLSIFIEGENFVVPASIGSSTPGPIIGLPNEDAHTHSDDGILHFNEGSPQFRNLKELFDTWGAIFTSNRLRLPVTGQPGQFIERTTNATRTLRLFVNGQASPDFELYEPEDGDQMVISYEAIPGTTGPRLNPINNATLVTNPTASGTSRTMHVPLDGTDPNRSQIRYSVESTNSNVSVQVAPSTNRSLRLTVSGRSIEGTNFRGDIIVELFEDLAPATTARIIQLVNQGFYSDLTFHRILNDFVAQGGDPSGDGTGGSGTEFSDEFHEAATFSSFAQLAMANSGDDSNDSQFFITDSNLSNRFLDESSRQAPPASLNFNHTVFGQVTSGFDILYQVMLTPVDVNPQTGERSVPRTTVRIENAEIFDDDQHGVLRISAGPEATGSAVITVTATNFENVSTQRKFEVRLQADEINDRAFLRTLSDRSTPVDTPVTINIPAKDIDGDMLTYTVRNPNSFSTTISKVSVSIDQATGKATITPDPGFTGTVDLLLGVRDQTRRTDSNRDGRITDADDLDARNNFDTQVIKLTVSNNSQFSWTNATNNLDVDNNNVVSPLDALLVINELNNREISDPQTGRLPPLAAPPPNFLDVTGDEVVAPLDALLVINSLPDSSPLTFGRDNSASPAGVAFQASTDIDATNALLDSRSKHSRSARRSQAIDAIWAKDSAP